MNTFLVLLLLGICAWMSWHRPRWMVVLCLACSVLGEFSRVDLPIGPRGILISDLLIPLFLGIWILRHWATHQKFPTNPLYLPLLCFSILNAIFLIWSPLDLSRGDLVTSILYFVRFIGYGALIPITAEVFAPRPILGRHLLLGTGLLLALLGFAQLAIFPDFQELAEIGWDPHINRLLATWFDPNFVGGLLGLTASIGLGVCLSQESSKQKLLYGASTLLMLAALFFTYSRSGYLMFMVSATCILLLRNPKLFLGLLIAGIAVLPLSDRALERVQDLYGSALALVTNDYSHSLDPTAKFRVESWNQSIAIFQKHPIHAIGYNTLKVARIEEGFEKTPDSHAATGADSSLLLILATTGILGTFTFLWFIGGILYHNWHAQRGNTPLAMLNTITLGSTLGLLVHSMFVNSIFFPFMLIPYSILVGLSFIATDHKKTT